MKSKSRKFLSLFLAVLMIVSVVPLGTINAIAATGDTYIYTDPSTGSSFTYEITSEVYRTCRITKYSGNDVNLIIPSNLNGYRVTEIGKIGNNLLDSYKVINNNTAIKTILIPEGVIAIGTRAFANKDIETKRVIIPKSIVAVGPNAFSSSPHLSPNKYNTIETYYTGSKADYEDINSHFAMGGITGHGNLFYAGLPLEDNTDKIHFNASYEDFYAEMQINDIDMGTYALRGAIINIFGYEIPLIDIEASIKLGIGNVKIISDRNAETVQVLLGFDQNASANIEASDDPSYWRKSYQEVKSMYQDLTGNKVDTTRLWNKFSSMRGKLKSSNADSMVVNVKSELAGYIEFKRQDGNMVFSSGGIMAEFSANTSLRSYYGPCYVCLGIGVGAKGTLSFTNENNSVNPQITVSPNFTVSAGGGIGTRSTYAELAAYGTLSATIATQAQTPFRAGIDIGARWSGYIIGKEIFSGSKSFAKMELYPNFGGSYNAISYFTPGLDASNIDSYKNAVNSSQTISRDYLNHQNSSISSRRSAKARMVTQEFRKDNIYPLNEPSLVSFKDDSMMLVWIDDNGLKSDENLGTLMYSYYDGQSWSVPNSIYENGTNNDMPCIYSDGTYAYIIWQKANTEFSAETDTVETLKQYDLYETTFNSESLTFSEPVRITDNNEDFEIEPVICGLNGAFRVAWIVNSENNVYQMSGNNTVYTAEYDENGVRSSSKTIISTENVIPQILLGSSKLYYAMNQGEKTELHECTDSDSIISTDIYDFDVINDTVYYLDSAGLNMKNDTKQITDGISGIDNFRVASNGKDIKLFTSVLNSDFTEDLYCSKWDSENNVWLPAELYASDGKSIRKYAPVVLSDGSEKVAFNYYLLDVDSNTQQSSLVVKGITDSVDISVNYVDFDDAQLKEKQLDLTFEVENNSSTTVNELKVEIVDENDNVLKSETINAALTAFEKKKLSIIFSPEDCKTGKITLRVLPIETEDNNIENNSVTTTLECLHVFDYVVDLYPTAVAVGKVSEKCLHCGMIKETKDLPCLAISGASLTLNNDLTINYKVAKLLFDNTGYEKPYIVFNFNGIETVVNDYEESGNYFVFKFENISPNKMNDTIKATLYANIGNSLLNSVETSYSVATYCYNMLNRYGTDEYAKLRTLLVDLLDYGAKSQIYTDYKVDDLCNKNLGDEQLSFATAETPLLESCLDIEYETIENPTAQWNGAGLVLNNSINMRFILSTENVDGLCVRVKTSSGGLYFIYSDEFVKTENGYYVYFQNLNAGQLRDKIYVTAFDGETQISNTICYSVESYAFSKQNSTDINLSDLVNSMMKYGDSAYAYAR